MEHSKSVEHPPWMAQALIVQMGLYGSLVSFCLFALGGLIIAGTPWKSFGLFWLLMGTMGLVLFLGIIVIGVCIYYGYKKCPSCCSTIQKEATRCLHCHYEAPKRRERHLCESTTSSFLG